MFKKLFREESGQALPFFALFLVVLLGFGALVVDGGMLYAKRADLQKAADAAALAGARALPVKADAEAAALLLGSDNGAPQANILVTTPYLGDSNKVEVITSDLVPSTFARVLGINQSTVKARAVAERIKADVKALKYTLFSGEDEVTVTSNKLTIVDGDVYGNDGIDASGAEINGSAVINTEITNKTLDVAKATEKIGPVKETIPDLWSSVEPIAPVTTRAAFNLAVDYDPITKTAKLNNEIVRYEELQNKNTYKVLDLQGVKFTGVGIIYSAGPLDLDGGGQTSASDSIIFYSGDSSDQAIHFTGSGQTYTGYLYAPNGGILLSGEGATLYGRAIAKEEVKFAGGNASISGAISEEVFNMLKYRIRLID